jgi:hypothetical protein
MTDEQSSRNSIQTQRIKVRIFYYPYLRGCLTTPSESSKMDSSLKRHTAFIKRMRQSIGTENRDHILKDIETLSLEKYIDEIAGATVEGVGRCKTEKDVWSAVEVRNDCSPTFFGVS